MPTDADETRQEKYSRQTSEQYAALGKYVQEFELTLHAIRLLIAAIFHNNGLRNLDLIDVLTHHRSVTSQIVMDYLSSVMTHSYSSESDEIAVLSDLRKRFEREVKIRNEYLHGTWLIGWANESQQDFSEIDGFKMTSSSKEGLQLRKLATSVSEIQARIDALDEIRVALMRLHGCLVFGHSVKNNFVKFEGRYISPETARKRGWDREQ